MFKCFVIICSLIDPNNCSQLEDITDIHNPPTGSVIGKAIESKDTEDPDVIEVLMGRL